MSREFKNLHVSNHPLIAAKLSELRSENTGTKKFRELVLEISVLLSYEATADFKLKEINIKTPVSETKGYKLKGKKPAVIPVLRAGLGMETGVLSVLPHAKVGHIGLYRDEKTFKPVSYFLKLPGNIEKRKVIVTDPMLATGASAAAAVSMLKERGAKNIRLMCIVAAPEGAAEMEREHPDVKIFAAALDEKLNEKAYIMPGLGDAGDRLFGTPQ